MSCPQCDYETEHIGERPIAYVRVGTGNVVVIGCTVHVTQLLTTLAPRAKPKKCLDPELHEIRPCDCPLTEPKKREIR